MVWCKLEGVSEVGLLGFSRLVTFGGLCDGFVRLVAFGSGWLICCGFLGC